jgi:hypothetical protein
VPTILMSALGIVLLAAGPSPSVAAVAGTLVTIVEDAMVFA